MKKSLIALALASFMIAGLQGITLAEGTMPIKHHKIQAHEQGVNLGKKLNLTEEQSAKAKGIRENSRSKIKPLIEELRAEKEKYREMVKNKASKEALQTQREKILELRKKAQVINKENMANFEQILTPEQKTQFSELKKAKMEKMKQKREQHKKHMQEKLNQNSN